VYDPDYLRSFPSIPVPASVTTVAGCTCGGSMEWHTQDCGIWSLPRAEAMAAIDDARQRLRDGVDDLNRQLQAALRTAKRA
jgi:hypothetical protein